MGVLEIIDQHNAVIRIWYLAQAAADAPPQETFVDARLRGVDTTGFTEGAPLQLAALVRVSGNQSFGATCGGRGYFVSGACRSASNARGPSG